MSLKKIILFSIVAIISILLIKEYFDGGLQVAFNRKELRELNVSDKDTMTFVLSSDSSMINDRLRETIDDVQVINSKHKRPVETVTLMNKYFLAKFILNDSVSGPVCKNLNFREGFQKLDVGYTYRMIPKNYFQLKFRAENTSDPSEIYCIYEGDSIYIEKKSDSSATISLLCKSLSIKFEKDGPAEIRLQGKSRGLLSPFDVPVELMFLTRSGRLLCYALVPLESNEKIPRGVLAQIIGQ